MRMSPELDMVGSERLQMKLPIWFQANKFNSLAKWLILFIERAIWVHYNV